MYMSSSISAHTSNEIRHLSERPIRRRTLCGEAIDIMFVFLVKSEIYISLLLPNLVDIYRVVGSYLTWRDKEQYLHNYCEIPPSGGYIISFWLSFSRRSLVGRYYQCLRLWFGPVESLEFAYCRKKKRGGYDRKVSYLGRLRFASILTTLIICV